MTRTGRLVTQGRLRAATRVLLSDSDSTPPVTEDIARQLQDLHPSGPHDPFPHITYASTAAVKIPSPDGISLAILGLSDSAPGPSGWTPMLLRIAAEVPQCVTMLHCMCADITSGAAPVRNLFCSSLVTPIPKHDGKVRPLAIGELV